MNTQDAKELIGKKVDISFMLDGKQVRRQLIVMDVENVPLYGSYLIGDTMDVSLGSVVRAVPLS